MSNVMMCSCVDASTTTDKQVNCARFQWMRLRLIEDGALAAVQIVIASLPTRENTDDLVLTILLSVRALSENPACRTEMQAKGSFDILYQLLPYADEPCQLLIIKTLHNLLLGTVILKSSFEAAVMVVCDLAYFSVDPVTLQYCSACILSFIQEPLLEPKLALLIVENLPKLLLVSDPLVQFCAINTAGTIFFERLW